MADQRKLASTSNTVRFCLKNGSTGVPLTGLTSASSGLIISTAADNEATATAYTVAGSTIETISTLGTFATPTSTKCRFKEFDSANHPGLYEFQFADARFAVSGAKRLVISVSGATSLLATDYEIQLLSVDPYDGVRLGLSSLPNAAANASGGLPVNNSGLAVKADVDTIKTQAVTCAAGVTVPTSLASPTNITAATGIVLSGVTHTGAVIPTVTTCTTATNLTNAPTAGDLTSTMKTSVTTAASAATPVATVSGDLSATMKTSVTTACTASTPTAAAVTGNVGGNVVGSVGSLTLTQAIPTSNTAQTLGDCLNAARAQGFGKWAISGTTLTLYASDGTTAVRTFTLDSSTAPTSRT